MVSSEKVLDKHVSTHTLTYIHIRIQKLNPCMATFLTWYPIAKTFYRIKTFSSLWSERITLELIVLTSELLHALIQTFDWVIVTLAIWPSSKLMHMRSAVKWFVRFSYYIWFIPFEQTINKHWYRNLIFFPLGMIDLSFEINQFHFIVTTMRVKPHENGSCCRQTSERNMHLHHNAFWHLKISI